MIIHQESCRARDWLRSRHQLASALASGRYAQQPPSEEPNPPMRDNKTRYTVTGVAADQSPIVWVNLNSQWHAVWMDVLAEILPGQRSFEGDLTGLSDTQQQRLMDSGEGDTTELPETTACQLGLHTGYGHESQLTVNPNAYPESVRVRLGLPNRKSPYQANDLSFDQAAHLIALHPLALGSYSCGCE